jgi:hypothetical protein
MFCKPVSSKRRFLPFRKLNEDFSFTLFEKAEQLTTKDWDSITKKSTVFLERDYLKIVEDGKHVTLTPRYIIVFNNGIACGIIYFQILDFKANVFEELLSDKIEVAKSHRLRLFENYVEAHKTGTLLRLFTCGNNLISGEFGFLFDKKIDPAKANELLLGIIDVISKEEKLERTLSAILIKDFHKPLKPKSLLSKEKYLEFFVEPNLKVEIPKNINSLADYIELFSKKYRNRAKSIFKSIEPLEVKYLTLAEIKKSENDMYALYESIFNQAKFKLIKLPTDYFSRVKAIFESTFIVKGFFYNNKLIAFASSFTMPNNSIEAHYIGFNYDLNTTFNLYQNILYSMINEALLNTKQIVNLGRTSPEIKTTVGAKAHNLSCYIKPQNTVSRLIQKPFIAFLQPADWTPRNPFKETNVLENGLI